MRSVGRICVVTALALVMGACTDDDPGRPAGETTSPVAPQTEAPPSTEGVAIWPEDTHPEIEAAAADPEGYRDSRDETALAFAAKILRWDDATVAPYEGPIQCGPGECVVVARPNGHSVLVTAQRFVQDVWSVRSVAPNVEGAGAPLGLSVEGRQVSAVFDLGEAASAEFRISYGQQTARHEYTESAVTDPWEIGFEPSEGGHFVILFKNAKGTVIDAQGAPLPAGDFAAG